jgi:hypothetical protein
VTLSIHEQAFVVEHYFGSYGEGQDSVPSVQMAKKGSEQELHEDVPI